VGEVVKAPHKTPLLCGVHFLCRAVTAQLQPLLHQSGLQSVRPASSTARLA
jgi:hypothetical protein